MMLSIPSKAGQILTVQTTLVDLSILEWLLLRSTVGLLQLQWEPLMLQDEVVALGGEVRIVGLLGIEHRGLTGVFQEWAMHLSTLQ